ncbi:MAG: hypothetical protein JXQ73_31715 [Phycisphaerae bacterium]|nr:hypothetical protein [Phycisphaerae bacterium]
MNHRVGVAVCAGFLAWAVLGQVEAGEVGTPLAWQDHELAHVKKSHAETVTSKRHEYGIRMGGTVDMDHALTRECGKWRVGWQPNESLTVANVGSVPVEDVKVIVNDRGDWYTLESLLDEAIGSAKSDQERVYLIWQFARSNRHHDDPLYEGAWGDELHDPVKMLAMYGAGLCDDAGSIGASLFHAAGLRDPKPFVRCLHGHMMCEAFASGRWQFMDIDEDVFYLDRENELPVSGDTIARDHDLAHREFHYGPIFGTWQTGYRAASLFGRDDDRTGRLTQGYKIRVCLRPNERIEYRWDNVGKWSMRLPTRGRRWVGNSRKVYEPSPAAPKAGAEEARGVASSTVDGKPAIAGQGADGELVYRMTSAWVFCGGRVTASFALRDSTDRAVIEVWAKDNKGKDKTEPVNVWVASGPGAKQADVEIDKAIEVINGRPEYEFFVRIRLVSASGQGGAALTHLAIRGDVMVSPLFLPRLRLGENKVVYTDGTESPGKKVEVTYRWRETTATRPLPAPKRVFPPDGQTIRDEVIRYTWEPVAGAAAYHLQVFRDPALRWPYRPSLDVVFKGTEFAVPFWGIYGPETTYYWRARTQNDKGIWGDYGEVRTFKWSGPRVPLEVKLTQGDGVFTLSWRENPRGERPVRYEVYGSDIKGFSVCKGPHEIPTLGKVPGNYLGQTESTSMIVGGHKAAGQVPAGVEDPNQLNRCYYRVVAVDGHGTHGICSDYVEMPHPFIWTAPVTEARVGQPYTYEAKAIRDLGDLQYRYSKPGHRFWESERLAYSLAGGPKWLKVEGKTGVVTGTPPGGSAGKHAVRLCVEASFEKRTDKDTFTKDLPPRRSEQGFELMVRP